MTPLVEALGRPTSESWVIRNADRSGGPSILGTEQIVASPAGRWEARLTWMMVREEMLPMRGLLAGLRGRSGTMVIGPYDLTGSPHPGVGDRWALDLGLVDQRGTGSNDGAGAACTVVLAAAMNAMTIRVQMQGGRVPLIGQYVGIGPGLHVITDVGQDAGQHVFALAPWLRADIPAGAIVEFGRPTCTMRLGAPVSDLTVQGGSHVTNVTLDLVEAF